MTKYVFLIFVIILFQPIKVYSADPRPEMHALADEITILQKYLFTENSFTVPESRQRVKNSLGAIQGHLEKLKDTDIKNDPSLRINLEMLQQHMSDTSRALDASDFSYARNMLRSSLQMCISCHTRKATADFSWPESDMSKMQEMDRADYYFATRQFSKGKKIYEGVIQDYPKNKATISDVRKALLDMAIYYAKVQESPKEGVDFFKKVAMKKEIPVYLTKESESWAKEFSDWSKETQNKKKSSASGLLSKAKKLLEDDSFTLVSELGRSYHIRRLRASTLFHQVLEDKASSGSERGEALYFLGKIYATTSSNLFFRFGEMYFKACIQENKKTNIAQKCYISLEAMVIDGYSGSAGTSVPDDEKEELGRLKKLAF